MSGKVIPAVAPGRKRQWVKCKTCERPSYYDFTPYSMSTPLMIPPCHGIDMSGTMNITADEALILLNSPRPERTG